MATGSCSRLSKSTQRLYWGLLGLSASPIVAAYLYNNGYQPAWSCPLRYWTGIPCPTCGMTRSFIAMVQGNLAQAAAYHLFGPVLFIGLLLAIVQIALMLLLHRQVETPYTWTLQQFFRNRKLSGLIIAILLIYYLFRLCILAHSGALYAEIMQAPLGKWLLL